MSIPVSTFFSSLGMKEKETSYRLWQQSYFEPSGPGVATLLYNSPTWILVRQEVHTLGIGTGNVRASRTGPGPNIP